MSMSTTETIGFCNQLIQLLQDNQTDLQQKGLDVSGWITELTTLNNDTIAQDATHDNMRVAFKEQTKKAQDSANLTYKTTSTKLDAVIGVLGKDTLLAKQAARLRSSIIKQKNKKTTEKTEG